MGYLVQSWAHVKFLSSRHVSLLHVVLLTPRHGGFSVFFPTSSLCHSSSFFKRGTKKNFLITNCQPPPLLLAVNFTPPHTASHPQPLLLAVKFTPPRPAVILPPVGGQPIWVGDTAVILQPCWQSNSPLPAQGSIFKKN